MPAYITVDFSPTDKEKLQEYGAAVPASLTKFSGEYLVKGPAEQLFGDTEFQMQVILTFPSRELALAWYHSPDYQTLVPLRNAAMRSEFRLVHSVQ
ncbi:DUF1330 domain-containing protein [Undibacterium parvum]|uniref:DUF1330 domain-containing protein n=1 Tax=Undibacterium parvum TaxID=401471 RepID=A0A3S9HI25_9BURK|nr:DUF1330 domain-containing protein [Undibacterium parvum]AZP11771.1 DUF1330 domain-containing protein [Undibacterium parvum]